MQLCSESVTLILTELDKRKPFEDENETEMEIKKEKIKVIYYYLSHTLPILIRTILRKKYVNLFHKKKKLTFLLFL